MALVASSKEGGGSRAVGSEDSSWSMSIKSNPSLFSRGMVTVDLKAERRHTVLIYHPQLKFGPGPQARPQLGGFESPPI